MPPYPAWPRKDARLRKRPPEAMSVNRASGGPLDFGIEPPAPTETMPLRLIEVLRPRMFDDCPICGDPATTEEHVPPQRLGGTRMTRTCARSVQQQLRESPGSRPGRLVRRSLVDIVLPVGRDPRQAADEPAAETMDILRTVRLPA